MNNPFATVPTPAQQPSVAFNPFAPQAPVQQHTPSFPTTAPTANPFALVTQAPTPAPPVQVPVAPPTQGVAAIQAAFNFPPLNPPGEAGLGLQPVAVAPVQVQVEVPTAPAVPQEPAPKARRSRKAKADVQGDVQGDVDAALLRGDVQGAIDASKSADYSPADEDAMRYGVQPTLDTATTEELRDALNARGWNVTLVAS